MVDRRLLGTNSPSQQCWHNAILPKLQCDCDGNSNIFIPENALENTVCKMSTILYWSLGVDANIAAFTRCGGCGSSRSGGSTGSSKRASGCGCRICACICKINVDVYCIETDFDWICHSFFRCNSIKMTPLPFQVILIVLPTAKVQSINIHIVKQVNRRADILTERRSRERKRTYIMFVSFSWCSIEIRINASSR